MRCESCDTENIEGAKFCASCGIILPQPPGEHPWIGRLVGGRFRVTSVLGEGGMGVVYAGEQQMGSQSRKVAIKTLHPHLSHDVSVLARFHRECGTVSQLEHPNTIKVYDFGTEADGTLYIAMEYVQGRSLDKIIESEGPMPPNRVVNILKQVCGALDEAHDLGVVHRDLKPENIVLGERLGRSDFVKVLDFGIAARSESASAQKEKKLTQQGMVLGTPPYMSPEQFTGQELDRRSDIYSLGIMAYEMLTQQLPFNAQTPWQWATEHMTAQPFPMDQLPSGHGVPRSMRDAVMRALSKNPDDRPATAGAFLAELEAGLTGAISATGATGQARTEAMQAAPSGVTGPTPSFASAPSGQQPTSHALSATQDIEIPVRKSKTGLLVGAVAGVIGLAAGAYFVVGGKGKTGDDTGPEAAGSGAPTTTAAPTTSPPPTSAPTTEPAPTAMPSTDPTTTTPAVPTTTPTAPTSPTKPPVPVTPKPPEKLADCSSCNAAIASGEWSRAASIYAKCEPGGQSSCSAAARTQAGTQAKAAGKSCSKLKSMLSAAQTMGVPTKRIDDALEAAKCK